MAMGGGVRGGIYGTAPSLDPNPANPTLENNGGDVRYETDFRSVYAKRARRLARRRLGGDSRRRFPRGRTRDHLGMTTRRWVAMAAAVVLVTGVPAAPSARQASDEARRVRDATSVFDEIMAADDRGIPQSILSKAEGIAVFPSMVRGGFIVGGMRGRGILSSRNNGEWSPPAFLTLTGGSFGLQIGGQAVDLILVINDRRGLESLVANQFKLGADVAVAAGPVGRDAQASTDLQLRAQILSYSRSRGLFAGVTVNGSTVRQDREANRRFYGMPLETRQIVFGAGPGSHPDPAAGWLQVLDRYARP